jgi:hypothetical protein
LDERLDSSGGFDVVVSVTLRLWVLPLFKRLKRGKTQRRRVAELTKSQTIPQVDKSNTAKRVRPRRKNKIPQNVKFIETTVDESGNLLSYAISVNPKRPKDKSNTAKKAETAIDESTFLLNYVSTNDIIITDDELKFLLNNVSTNDINFTDLNSSCTTSPPQTIPQMDKSNTAKKAETAIDESTFLLNYVSTNDIIITDDELKFLLNNVSTNDINFTDLNSSCTTSPPQTIPQMDKSNTAKKAETAIDESKFLLNYVSTNDIIINDLSGNITSCNTIPKARRALQF